MSNTPASIFYHNFSCTQGLRDTVTQDDSQNILAPYARESIWATLPFAPSIYHSSLKDRQLVTLKRTPTDNIELLMSLTWISFTLWNESAVPEKSPWLKQAEHANLHIELNLWPYCYKAAMLNAAPHVIYTVLCAVVYLIIGCLYFKWLIWLTIIRYFSALFFL